MFHCKPSILGSRIFGNPQIPYITKVTEPFISLIRDRTEIGNDWVLFFPKHGGEIRYDDGITGKISINQPNHPGDVCKKKLRPARGVWR